MKETTHLYPCPICYFPYWLLSLTWQVVVLMSVAQSLHTQHTCLWSEPLFSNKPILYTHVHSGHTLVLSSDQIAMLCALWLMSPWTVYTHSIGSCKTHWFVKCHGLSLACPGPAVCELFWENCTMLLKDMVTQQNAKALVNYFYHQIHIKVLHWI